MQQESNVTLEILIHDYLKKRNYTEAATNLKNEANIPDYNPKDCIPLLYEWFNAFNDIYNVRSGRVGCHENIARIENVMLKLENEKRKYKNIDSDKSMPEKTKSVHDMGYSSFNDKYSEYTTPKMSNYESSTSLYEPKIEKRSYSEAFDRRSNFEEKIKSQAMNGNAKQYYGRTEGDSIEEGNLGYPKEGQRYRSQYGASTVARENEHTMGYSNDYLRAGYNDLPRMGYPNEQTRQPYKNESAKSPYENESVRIQYGNDPSKMHYSNEMTRPPYSGDAIKMPYGSETGKMQYGTDAKKMSYKEHANGYKNDYQKMGYGSRKYQQESKLPYDKSYSADDLTNDNIANYNDRFLKDPYKNYECLTKITSLQLHKQRINAICVSNKHNIFITGGHDQVINIVDILTFRVTRIDLDVKIISDIKLNERTNELLVAADSDIYIYKLADLSILRVLREHKCSIKDICIDGEFMYTTDVEGTLKKWKGYDVLESVELHVRRLVIFNGVIVASDRNKVFTYDLDKRAVIDVLYDDCAFIKVYSSRLMLFLKTKVFILDENFESINVIACNEKVQSGCILSDNAVLLGFYQGMTKHINNEMFTVNSEGSVMVLEKYVKDSEIVIGGCYDGSVVVWEHH